MGVFNLFLLCVREHTHTHARGRMRAHIQRKHYNLIHVWLHTSKELTNMHETFRCNHKQLECQKHKDVETFCFTGLMFMYLYVKG